MAYGYPPYVSERRRYAFHFNNLIDAAEKALYLLGWIHQPVSHYQYRADIGRSLFSHGEDFLVSIYDDGIIDAVSTCKTANSGLDFGKNRRNIVNFFKQLDRELGLVKEEPAEKKKRKKHSFRKRVLGSKTGEPEDGELIER